ncbi:unnamed protein product [Durusdinium trenchii]|uniref:EF-hand domain-containing protein n=1 Tax=Durusdinium trenchii TaxID=1381693 RepID=A0ABP0MHA8_9DINO
MADLTSALTRLGEVQQQQAASLQGLESLSEQHREWRKAVDDLLLQVDAALKDLKEHPKTVPASSPSEFEKLNEEESFEDALKDVRSATNAAPKDANLSVPSQSIVLTQSMMSSASMREGGEAREAREGPLRKSMSSNSLLRSRTTVANDFPPGPLRKVVVEVLADDTEDLPAANTWWQWLQQKCIQIVRSRWFEFLAGFVILLNLITIGIEAHVSVTEGTVYNSDFWPGGVERIFLSLYCIEAIIRVLAGGWSTFKDWWFLLDLVLIIVGLLALLVIPIMNAESDMSGSEKLLVVRGLRLFRLMRALRMLSHFKIVWRLVYGLLTAVQTIISMTMLIAVSLFIFACVAIELIAKDHQLQQDETTRDILSGNFAGLPSTLLTLLQFVTLDDVADVYFPLIMAKPYLCAFFFPILMFISVGLMNLVTASLVENAMQTAALEAEEERLKLKKKVKNALPSLIEIFHQLDADHSGLITHDEVENVPVSILPPRVLDSICVENMADIFDYLDVDGTGELTQMEFVEGLLNLCLLDMPISTIQCLKLLQLLRGGLGRMDEKMHVLGAQVSELHDNICGSVIRNVRV